MNEKSIEKEQRLAGQVKDVEKQNMKGNNIKLDKEKITE
jgi:hypothetical protein